MTEKKDSNFTTLAMQHSEDQTGKMGGDLGTFPRKGIPKLNSTFEDEDMQKWAASTTVPLPFTSGVPYSSNT